MSPPDDERHDQFRRLLPAHEAAIRPQARLLLSTLAARVGLDQLGEVDQSLPHIDGWGSDNCGLNHRVVNDAATIRFVMSGNRLALGLTESQDCPEFRTLVPPDQGCGFHWRTVYDVTILHLLGLDHERLTFYHNGIKRRLTDVHGHSISEILT